MKCKNCDANYKTKDLSCPYCGPENFKGRLWKLEVENAQLKYEQKKKYVLSSMPLYVINRMLNSVCLFILATIPVLIVVFFVVTIVYELSTSLPNMQHLEELHSAEQYDELYTYMSSRELFGGENEKLYGYRQAALLWAHSYKDFIERRMRFATYTEAEWMEMDIYDYERFLEDCWKLIHGEVGVYKTTDPMNEELKTFLAAEASAYLVSEFDFTKDELEILANCDFYDTELNQLAGVIMERKGAY